MRRGLLSSLVVAFDGFLPVTSDMMTSHYRGGLYSLYSIAHAQFVWDLKTEPAYIKLFEEIWGTDELLGESKSSAGISSNVWRGADTLLLSLPSCVPLRVVIPAAPIETTSPHENSLLRRCLPRCSSS